MTYSDFANHYPIEERVSQDTIHLGNALVEAGLATPEQRTTFLESLARQADELFHIRQENFRKQDAERRALPWRQRAFGR